MLRFWDTINDGEKQHLLAEIDTIDFALMKRLTEQWVFDEPPPERFEHIVPVPTLPIVDPGDRDALQARDAGEDALRQGRVGLLLVAGGQGTRLGFDGPKGAYPIGPITKKSLFAYHAEKIRNLQRRYDCVLPWYIMVSEANEQATRVFFQANEFFGMNAHDVTFFKQRMVPCVDDLGKFLLDAPGHIAMNPNGHGGTIPAVIETGVVADAKARGVDLFSYFQVDNWAVKVADPYFIGYHVLADADMSSKVHPEKAAPAKPSACIAYAMGSTEPSSTPNWTSTPSCWKPTPTATCGTTPAIPRCISCRCRFSTGYTTGTTISPGTVPTRKCRTSTNRGLSLSPMSPTPTSSRPSFLTRCGSSATSPSPSRSAA